MKYFGSCLCKTVEYEVTGVFNDFYLCHCSYCRKDTGSAHAANLFSKNGNIEWTKGESNVRTYRLDKTQHIKSFCKICGSALPNLQMEGKLLVVPAGSLDTPVNKIPDGHLFISSRADWDKELHLIKSFDKYPE